MSPPPSYDLLVVGAGILGLATAWQAARRGWRVAVVDRQARCIGASLRNFGFVTVSGQGPAEHWQRARLSRDAWAEVAEQAGIAVLGRGAWVLAQRPEAAALLEAYAASAQGEGCRLLGAAEARQACPAARPGAALMYSPHELRVESREALPRLARWLAQVHGVTFHWRTAVLGIDLPRVHSSRGVFHAERCVVCPGHDLVSLFPERLDTAGIRICTLQMLRLRHPAAATLIAPVLSDLSLLRYAGFSVLPQAQALSLRLQREQPEHLRCGVHLIAAPAADGSLVVGDSHSVAEAEQPFAQEAIDRLILTELRRVLHTPDAAEAATPGAAASCEVLERWTGSYASAAEPVRLDRPAPGVALGLVTGGTGASTAFALAFELLDLVET